MPGVDGPRLSVETKRLFKRLGIKDASFHTLRHTAASWLVMRGADLYSVGQLLGHKTLKMTKRYAHLSPGFMQSVAGKLAVAFKGVLPESAGGDYLPDAAALLSGVWFPQKLVMSSSLTGEIRNFCANSRYFLRATSMSCELSLSVPRSKRCVLPKRHTCQHTGK